MLPEPISHCALKVQALDGTKRTLPCALHMSALTQSGHAFSKYFLKNSRNYHTHEQFDGPSVAVFDIIIII